MTGRSLHNYRQNYGRHRLNDVEIDPDPLRQFADWFASAEQLENYEANAMLLSTVDSRGEVASRTVLLKSFDRKGFVFYTNYNSRKAKAIESHPQVSITFFWPPLERQVHILGRAKKVSAAESDAYFATRPYGSQLGAWVSPQSEVITDRQFLEEKLEAVSKKFSPDTIERPPHWGGYVVAPYQYEFWQGRPNRLHDRIRYRQQDGAWINDRLAP